MTLEAGGCGLPIYYHHEGAADLVKHIINGLIVEAGNVDHLTRALRRMADGGTLRNDFAKKIAQDGERYL
ncbi:glycosyltransferase [Rhizobium mesoamericanum]|uniref:glycosyltransferase n=1 Tax=Rhizobium mesoamericanum TaxID=1079800 RepID=UPI0026952A45